MTLNFEKAGKVDVTLDVQAIGARQPGGMSMAVMANTCTRTHAQDVTEHETPAWA